MLASWIKSYHLDSSKIWRKLVDFKYDLSPNILCAEPNGCSPFWKGIFWAAKAAKMGFRWKIGNGNKIRFWSDVWIGNCSLAILFRDLFIIVNEQDLTVAQVWDGVDLKFAFRRCVSPALFDRWLELCQLVGSDSLSEEEIMPLWMLQSSGVYSVRSFYAIINNRGVVPVHTPAVWSLKVPPRLHVFLWLLANNRLLTRYNLSKRRHVDDLSCLFCSEPETCHHLFFDCVVAKMVWSTISELVGTPVGADFESVARWWISNKNFFALNTTCTAALWSLWKLRNDMCFQGKAWPGVKDIWRRMVLELDQWKVLSEDAVTDLLARNVLLLNKKRGELLRIAWSC